MDTKTQTVDGKSLAALAKIPADKYNHSLIAGTGLQGYVKTSYDQLIDTFGLQTRRDSGDGKVSFEWVLRVGSTIATIYDYKGDCPINGTVAEWHVGGGKGALQLVAALAGFETRGR